MRRSRSVRSILSGTSSLSLTRPHGPTPGRRHRRSAPKTSPSTLIYNPIDSAASAKCPPHPEQRRRTAGITGLKRVPPALNRKHVRRKARVLCLPPVRRSPLTGRPVCRTRGQTVKQLPRQLINKGLTAIQLPPGCSGQVSAGRGAAFNSGRAAPTA